jgi:hypothetical protein
VSPDGGNDSQTIAANVQKNRSPTAALDINRNYEFFVYPNLFSPSANFVVSTNPSSEVDHGSSPFSEPETRVKISVNVQVY